MVKPSQRSDSHTRLASSFYFYFYYI